MKYVTLAYSLFIRTQSLLHHVFRTECHIGLIRIYSPFLDIINRTFHFWCATNASFCHPGTACNKWTPTGSQPKTVVLWKTTMPRWSISFNETWKSTNHWTVLPRGQRCHRYYLNKEISRANMDNFRNIKIYLGHLEKYLTFY